ncbi:MAG: CHAT domain-containing protein [Terracidiphilus sp.]
MNDYTNPEGEPTPRKGDADSDFLGRDPLAKALDDLMDGQYSRGRASEEGKTAARKGGSEDCPELGAWLVLLGPQTSDARQNARIEVLLAHAAQCGNCAERLRLLTADATAEEAAELSKLASASAEWKHELAAELARTPRRSAASSRTPRLYLWSGVGLAASLLLAVGAGLWWQHANTPERLLAEAYTHDRIFQLRMPDAGFADVTPQTHLRGGSASHESARLLDARARIERQLENAPEDPHWLQLEARADILEEKYDPAIDILDRLIAAGPVTSGLLVDDAAAYFQRGSSTGSENDRTTALEYLRHADELAPGDPVVLFNEAVAMEDRGQVMNAVETWNRYLRFERDPKWLADGRRRLQALEEKLNQMKTHQSRMEQHLATPEAMLALAVNPATLGAIDEELSSTLLPKMLNPAFPMPVDCSRGSPCIAACPENCRAARTLLHALAASLELNHQDPWLTELLLPDSLPPNSSKSNLKYIRAMRLLALAIDADVKGDYLMAQQQTALAGTLFHTLGNTAGEDRALVERSYALLRSSDIPGCYAAAHPLLGRNPQFAWIQIQDLTQDIICDPQPGSVQEENPAFLNAEQLAEGSKYALLELRARIMLGSAAVDTGDTEAAWRDGMATVKRFYSGDYPPIRLYATLSGLYEVEHATPWLRVALATQREVLGVLKMTPSRALIPTERLNLAAAAIRAGAINEAQEQVKVAQAELAENGGEMSIQGFLAENENAMAKLYLERHDLAAASRVLDSAIRHMDGENNSYHRREYAVARGQLDLAEGHPEIAERTVREALLDEERLAGGGGADSIVLAQQDRELYAVLAGVWLAQGRPGEDILALWERYRLRILGEAAPVCPNKGMDCLKPRLAEAMSRLGDNRLLGQIVLLDRLLLYRATSQGVEWKDVPVSRQDLLAAAAPLEFAVSSPATPVSAVDRAARKVGGILLAQLDAQDGGGKSELLLEPDPLLGNLPWPSVETEAGPIGLRFNLEESPSLLLDRGTAGAARSTAQAVGKPLIVGASVASGENPFLPEVLDEARAVARFGSDPNLLLATDATEPEVAMRLSTATTFHFAGHAAQQDGGTRLLLAPGKIAPGQKDLGQDKPYLDSAVFRKHPPRATRLAVFSACSTGKKEEGWNHGMGDIVGTLAALGVPDVVATRWQIDSGSAVPMMDAFYGGLARGLTVPQALTSARQSLIRDARYRHPYYWAAYYASGTGRSDLSQVFHGAN